MTSSKHPKETNAMMLKEVLAGNPFTSKVVSQWKQNLDDFNCGRKRLADLKFVLDGDLECLGRKAREKLQKKRKGFILWYL